MEIYQGEISCLCEPLHIEFPNIYRVISRSLDELLKVIKHSDFTVNDLLAQIYLRASCSFFENLSESITEDQLRKAVCKEIQEPNITSTSLYVQLNKQTHNASVITTNETRIWSITNHLLINGIVFPKKNKLTCRLCIYPIPSSYNIQKILKHEEFQGKILNYKHQGASLILELSDEVFFNECVTLGAIRISDSERFRMGTYVASHKTDSNEIDEDTWYKTGMSRYKPDIMQFISDPNHEIFQYKWNSQIWLKQFNQTIDENNNEKQMRDRRHTPSDITRHQLRVTAMLNTLAVIRKKSYMIHDRHFQLDVDKNMKTIIYDQRSMLEQGGKLPITKPPYRETRVEVFNEDCLVVYERLVKQNYKPLLLNMANASNPGGGYRKGDGAQEENLFRRSDYFRSLDVGLDQWLSKRSARYHCSSNCQLDPLSNHNSMYPMHEYGAIYTSGLTVFRQAENTGYSFMEEPLKNVCSLAVAAYRDPKLDGNMLAQKFAVGTRKKIENIFAIAFHHKHDSLVLSALGCGAFKNPPGHVAELFLSVIEQYAGFFKLITFAILDDHNSGRFFNPNGNFRPFQTLLNGITVTPLSPMNTSLTIFGPYRLLSDGLSTDDVCICDKPLCKFGATCIDLHNRKHVKEYSHPPHCPHAATKGQCKFTDNIVHMKSFVHRTQCRYGGECREINDEKHTQEFEHPVNCPDGSKCVDIGDKHLKQYRHLPLCPEGLQCLKFKMYDQSHCDTLRHCALNCPFGNNCGYIHDKQHQDRYVHPVPPTCPFTPFNCKLYTKFLHSTDCNTLDDDILNHCLDLAHICPLGRNCQDKSKLHLEKAIHIPRYICSDGNTCTELTNEDHLNTFTHVKILDIRKLCKYADECFDRRKVEHVTEYRHAARFEHSGILSVFNLNSGIDFVENQKNIIERIIQYVKDQNWTPLPSWTIPDDILNWIRTVQPVHRCNQVIFESILLHGHVMSREYMLNLKTPQFVANSVLHHSRIRRISDLQEKVIGEKAKAYIIALVQHYFTSKGFISGKIPDVTPATPVLPVDTHDELTSLQIGIEESEKYLSAVLKEKDLEAIRIKSNEIAEASINLHTNRAGIGYSSDKDLGTDKTVFSILGPHLGHYYGDIFIVFKRDILHHPDANFTIQAATSIISGNAFKLRPWLGTPVTDKEKLIELFNSCKLNCSIPGYEYAAALELIAFTSQHFGLNSMNITLDKIIERWFNVDSHLTIEGHLPQLIPLSYIEHIYIPQNLYNLLSRTSQKTMNATFRNSFTVVPYDGIPIQPQNPHGPTPPTKSREDFQNFVVEELRKKFIERVQHPSWTSIQGAAITMPFADFTKTYLLPLTISQAYKQYRYANRRQPKDETYYIYWQVVGGDMILTLSNESILSKGRKSNLQCLSCYIAGKGSLNDTTYHEYYSYVNDSAPFQHLVLREQNKFAAKSNQFFVGCNTDYLMTFCLEIQFSIGMVILSHAGPNSIYNHEKISFTFDKSRLDLQVLEFIHISCGSRTVPVRNLIVCFEKQTHLHPTFDKDFSTISSVSSKEPIHLNILPKKVVKKTDLIPCRDNVNCLLQHSKRYGPAHNVTYSHPCLFSELCTTKEAHLTHESHNAPKCKYDKKCKEINDPFHRVEYRHTNLPDFLIPCRHQNACYNDSFEHRIEFSHGEQVYKKSDSSPQSK
uniref:C3H1-type domain-containing protein n=1 Tax=Adineta vaga TaxID=104782 RepID=B3G4H5_ADIVA|nr:unknown [Adineta vaga]